MGEATLYSLEMHPTFRRASVNKRTPRDVSSRLRRRYYMNDAVYWRATDALDIRPDEWLQDVNKYHFSCDVGRFTVPHDEYDLERFVDGVRGIDSRASCEAFSREWEGV